MPILEPAICRTLLRGDLRPSELSNGKAGLGALERIDALISASFELFIAEFSTTKKFQLLTIPLLQEDYPSNY